ACRGRCCALDGSCQVTSQIACEGISGATYTAGVVTCPGSYSLIQGNTPLEDISSTGTQLFGVGMPPSQGSLDDGSVLLSLPFASNYDGVPKTAVQVTTNGYVTFDTAVGACCLWNNSAGIPAASLPNDVICPSWDDYFFMNTGTCKYELRGFSPNQRLII